MDSLPDIVDSSVCTTMNADEEALFQQLYREGLKTDTRCDESRMELPKFYSKVKIYFKRSYENMFELTKL